MLLSNNEGELVCLFVCWSVGRSGMRFAIAFDFCGNRQETGLIHDRLTTKRASVAIGRSEPHIQAIIVETTNTLRACSVWKGVVSRMKHTIANGARLHTVQLIKHTLSQGSNCSCERLVTHQLLTEKNLPSLNALGL